jgi:hypothetical protein
MVVVVEVLAVELDTLAAQAQLGVDAGQVVVAAARLDTLLTETLGLAARADEAVKVVAQT